MQTVSEMLLQIKKQIRDLSDGTRSNFSRTIHLFTKAAFMASKPKNKLVEFTASLRELLIEHEQDLVGSQFAPREELNSLNLAIQILRDISQYDPFEWDVERRIRRDEMFMRLRWDRYLAEPHPSDESPVTVPNWDRVPRTRRTS